MSEVFAMQCSSESGRALMSEVFAQQSALSCTPTLIPIDTVSTRVSAGCYFFALRGQMAVCTFDHARTSWGGVRHVTHLTR